MELKIAFLIMTLNISAVLANPTYSQMARVSLNMENKSLEQIMDKIESQSEFYFIFNQKQIDVSKVVSVQADNELITDVISKLFKGTNVNYVVLNKKILLTTDPLDNSLLALASENGAQQKQITGTVTDKNGAPLSGVNIVVTGTTQGAISDIDGKYSIDVPQGSKSLTFSFIGMQPQEISIGTLTQINVTMAYLEIGLDEIVIIGYGTSSKKKLTSAITSIKAEEIKDLPFSNVVTAIQGRGAGIIVKSAGGEPGSVPQLSIRGGGDPLYVIDGVVSDKFTFANINIEDIENISFLKDAASTAVYGSKAGDGIVLVKTKRGEKGLINATYSFMEQLSRPTMEPKILSSYDYVVQHNLISDNDKTAPTYSADVIQKFKDQSDPFNYPNTNWRALALKEFAPEMRHNLAINGGGDQTQYYVSFGYFNQGSIYKANTLNLDRYNVRTNLDTYFKEIGLKISFDVNATLQERQYPFADEATIWGNLVRTPTMPAFNLDGTYTAYGDHPLVLVDKRSGYNKYRDKYITTQIAAQWKVPKVNGLEMGVLANYTEKDSFQKSWSSCAPQYNPDGTPFVWLARKPGLNLYELWNKSYYLEGNISYIKTINKHTIDAKFLTLMSGYYGENFNASRALYMSSAVDQLFAGPDLGKDNGGSAQEGGNLGYVGRVKYDYASKYIIEGNFRYDGSDNFAPGHRFGLFPSISSAWIVSEEPFMASLKDGKILNYLKLRASYGSVGLMTGVNRFGYLFTYNSNPSVYVFDNKLLNGFSEGNLVSPELMSWYTQKSLNYGIDIATLNNKLSASFDYFYYRTTGFLMTPAARYTTTLGKSLPQINSNSAQRRAGFEFLIEYKETRGKLNYNIGLNFTKYDQLWETLATEDSVTLKNPLTRVTHRLDNSGRVYQADGLFQSVDQIFNSPRPLASAETMRGDIVYQDINGDGKIDDNDRIVSGKPSFPHLMYGINFGANFKGWFMSGLVQGTGDRYEMKEIATFPFFKWQLDYWRLDNTNAELPRAAQMYEVNGNNNHLQSTLGLWNLKYVRLKYLSFGYDFKQALLKNTNVIHSLRLSVSGSNILTFSRYFDRVDPEDAEATNGLVGYPVQKTYSINLSIGF